MPDIEVAKPQSTGPLTVAGKFESSKNALTHGLTASNIDRFPEAIREEFRAFLTQQYAEWAPATLNEKIYVERYAFTQFQLLRSQSLLALAQENFLAQPDNEALEKKLARIARHVKSLERSAKEALKELRTFIADRMMTVETNAHIWERYGDSIHIPTVFPHHLVVDSKSMKRDPQKTALRFAVQEIARKTPLVPSASPSPVAP